MKKYSKDPAMNTTLAILFITLGLCGNTYALNREDLLFYAPFDNGFDSEIAASGGAKVEGAVELVPNDTSMELCGRNGTKAAFFRHKGDLLRFGVLKNLNLPQGAVSLWVKELDTAEDQLIWNPYFQVYGEDQVFNIVRPWQPAGVAGGLWQNGRKITLAMGPAAKFFPWKKDQWHHILFTWRKNEITMYVNGIQGEKTSDGEFVLNDPLGTFTLGRPKDPSVQADDWHTGMHMLKDAPEKAREMKINQEPYGSYLLDDVAIFNRYLGPQEAKELFEKPMDAILSSGGIGAPSLSLENYLSTRKIKVNADFGKSFPPGTKIVAEVYAPDGTSQGITCDIKEGPGGLEYGYLDTSSLDPGEYSVKVRAAGKDIVETPKVSFVIAAKEPWADNTYGSEDVVLPGLEPLKADKDQVVMWGRKYLFNGDCMPRQIENQGSNMLVRPINWHLKVGGQTLSLIPKTSRLISFSPTRAVYETEGALGEMLVRGRVMVEYDGFMKFDLEFIPGTKPIEVEQLYMDIPFAPSVATSLFYSTRRSGRWEKDWHSPLTLTYTNAMTIGTPDICLQWLTESDQFYFPRGNDSALQAIDDNGAHVFRTNVIGGKQAIKSPIKLTFALQAGPVKARPANWRAWTMSPEQAALGPKIYNNVQYHYDWWARAPGELIPRKGFPAKRDPTLCKDEIQMTSLHFAGYRAYDETDVNKHTPEWLLHEAEWIRIPKLYEEQGCPGWGNTYVDTNSTSWSQWYIDNAYKLFSLTGMRGLYFDDWRNGPSMNEAAGSGYIDEEGIRRPVQPIFSQREIHRRIYAIVKKFRPDDGVIIMHTASQTFLPVISFCDVIYDGEVMIWADLIPPDGDYFKTFRNDLFQAMFTAKQYGPIPAFHDMTMQYAVGRHDKVGPYLLHVPNQRKLWAIMLSNDIHIHGGFSSGAQQLANIWLDSFGITDPALKFHPYWDPEPAATVLGGYYPDGAMLNNGSVFWASAYAKPGKALVLVVRNSPTNECSTVEVRVKLDRKKLGLPEGPLRCTNLEALGRSPLGKIEGDILKVDMSTQATGGSICNFAGIIIEPPQ